MSKTFPLSSKITKNGKNGIEEIAELTLRAPTFGEIDDYGPIADEDGKMNWKALKSWIGRLADISGAEVRALPTRDILPIAKWLAEEMVPSEVSEKN